MLELCMFTNQYNAIRPHIQRILKYPSTFNLQPTPGILNTTHRVPTKDGSQRKFKKLS